MFVINCKNYEEIAGDKIIQFVKIAEKVKTTMSKTFVHSKSMTKIQKI